MSKNRRLHKSSIARVKVWLEIDGDYVFGRGICDILQAVHATGSIKEAAQRVGKSYRHVWSRIKQAEQAIGAPLVTSKVGGNTNRRTELTPLATKLVTGFAKYRQTMIDLANQEFVENFPDLR